MKNILAAVLLFTVPCLANDWPFDARRGEPISNAQCEALGGHFWEEGDHLTYCDLTNTFNSSVRHRKCLLCGKEQRGVLDMEPQWQDVPAAPTESKPQ